MLLRPRCLFVASFVIDDAAQMKLAISFAKFHKGKLGGARH